jgi:hypothetical protein
MQINLFHGTQKDRLATYENVNHKPPTKRDRLFAILRFFLFAAAIGLFLTGLNIVLSKIPATASLLQQAEAGTPTASITLIIDTIGLLAVIGLSCFAAKVEGVPPCGLWPSAAGCVPEAIRAGRDLGAHFSPFGHRMYVSPGRLFLRKLCALPRKGPGLRRRMGASFHHGGSFRRVSFPRLSIA